MNERILELADKAVEDMPSGPWNIPDEFCKKFAELIVRECASKAWFVEQYGIGDGTPVSKQIKEHFGVEE
jgi:hypothetical protein